MVLDPLAQVPLFQALPVVELERLDSTLRAVGLADFFEFHHDVGGLLGVRAGAQAGVPLRACHANHPDGSAVGRHRSDRTAVAGEIEKVVRVSVLGVLWGTRAFLPGMLERGHGHVVNVASTAGRRGFAGRLGRRYRCTFALGALSSVALLVPRRGGPSRPGG